MIIFSTRHLKTWLKARSNRTCPKNSQSASDPRATQGTRRSRKPRLGKITSRPWWTRTFSIVSQFHRGSAGARTSKRQKEYLSARSTRRGITCPGASTVVSDCLRAGEFSMHTDLLLHGSEANQSTRRRCGLTLRYAAAEVRAYLDWNQKGVWVSGGDPGRHWANRPRPKED